jgi:hypothetical protein
VIRFTLPLKRSRPVRKPAPRPRTAPRRGERGARLLALAHAIDAGALSYAQVAHALGISRARVTQIAALTLLAPDIQQRLLHGDPNIHERALRAALRFVDWNQQRAALGERQ